MLKLQSKLYYLACAALVALLGVFLAFQFLPGDSRAYADDGTPIRTSSDEFFVTIHDQGTSLIVKTGAATVAEVLERSEVKLAETDLVEPSLDALIDGEYNINIYRSRPAVIIDGVERRYIMTASYDPRQIATEAGFTIYDGDAFVAEFNESFLETGVVSAYRIIRNGGHTITIDESVSYPTEIRYDYTMNKGESYLEQAGEDGRRTSVYAVEFENNLEISRTLVSEEILLEPVPEIIVVGAKVVVPPEREECASWARAAGVGEDELEVALELIYHESSCRISATNSSSGAYGIPQALPGNKMAAFGDDWETNPITQIRWMIYYVHNRYGGWQEAMNWWWEHHWY